MIDSKQLVEFAKQPQLALHSLKELLAMLEGEEETEQNCASELLENCGAPQPSDVSFLCEQLRSGVFCRVYWCSTLLGRLGPTVEPPAERSRIQTELCNTISDSKLELTARERAAWAMGELGGVDGENRSVLEKQLDAAPARLKRLLAAALAT